MPILNYSELSKIDIIINRFCIVNVNLQNIHISSHKNYILFIQLPGRETIEVVLTKVEVLALPPQQHKSSSTQTR